MAYVALILWLITAMGGLYMLAVWLIENDVTNQGSAPSRLPVPVIFGHLLLAVSGLAVWVAYLLLDREVLAWTALFILLGIALLGATMFARWIPVYRGPVYNSPAGTGPGGPSPLGAGPAPLGAGPAPTLMQQVPAEGNFPVLVVVGHGMLAVTTLVLVLLTALGVGGT
jgi:hypothetical protein